MFEINLCSCLLFTFITFVCFQHSDFFELVANYVAVGGQFSILYRFLAPMLIFFDSLSLRSVGIGKYIKKRFTHTGLS